MLAGVSKESAFGLLQTTYESTYVKSTERKSGQHGFRKHGDFATGIKGKYKKFRITETRIRDFFDIS